jgi:hypothetical protein
MTDINTTVEGAAAPVLVSDCQSCPLLDVAPPTSPLHRRGYIGRCLLSRAESERITWSLRDIPCLDRSRIVRGDS